MKLVADTGALLAVEQGSRHLIARLRRAQRRDVDVVTSSGAVAQAWRGGARQAVLARELRGIHEAALDHISSRAVGLLLGASHTSDVIDAHLALLAEPGDIVLTSDPDDLTHLTATRGVLVAIERV